MDEFLEMYISLPINKEAGATVQDFNILVSKTPVDAEVVHLGPRRNRADIVAAEEGDVLFLVGWRQKVLQSITQSLIGPIRLFVFGELLTP